MSDNELELQEWIALVIKGGEGSGEREGHPFRGNGHTGGVPQAGHHNPRGDEARGSHYHVSMAHAQVMAASQSLHSGDYGAAMRHFNEAARHGSWAGKKVMSEVEGKRMTHQDAKTTYAVCHNAGNRAQEANRLVRAYSKMLNSGNADPVELARVSSETSSAVTKALSSGSVAVLHLNNMMSENFGNALRNAAQGA